MELGDSVLHTARGTILESNPGEHAMAQSTPARGKAANGTSSFHMMFGDIASFIARATGRPLAF